MSGHARRDRRWRDPFRGSRQTLFPLRQREEFSFTGERSWAGRSGVERTRVLAHRRREDVADRPHRGERHCVSTSHGLRSRHPLALRSGSGIAAAAHPRRRAAHAHGRVACARLARTHGGIRGRNRIARVRALRGSSRRSRPRLRCAMRSSLRPRASSDRRRLSRSWTARRRTRFRHGLKLAPELARSISAIPTAQASRSKEPPVRQTTVNVVQHRDRHAVSASTTTRTVALPQRPTARSRSPRAITSSPSWRGCRKSACGNPPNRDDHGARPHSQPRSADHRRGLKCPPADPMGVAMIRRTFPPAFSPCSRSPVPNPARPPSRSFVPLDGHHFSALEFYDRWRPT